eukprot:TRINITY_DN1692_c0_g1_i1.p1 TRINITY_DN1692_c0_g1~~TRINITY_DN1692_c0_g1_i1.p1  ORF type:complete len:111 (-),score=18.35 TRINITY_DN1692_c0_g1_i1:103-435(-)
MDADVPFSSLRDTVTPELQKIVAKHLEKKVYTSRDAQNWTNLISEDVIKYMTGVSSNFKYVVTTIILQKSDSGLNVSSTCFWNSAIDGTLSVKWENQSMISIVNLFGIGL